MWGYGNVIVVFVKGFLMVVLSQTEPVGPGHVRVRGDGHLCYVPIPRNASMLLDNRLNERGWGATERFLLHEPFLGLAFCVVREPLDRWVSGVCWRAGGDPVVAEGLVGRAARCAWPVFDQHTMRQSDFVLSTVRRWRFVPFDRLELLRGVGLDFDFDNRVNVSSVECKEAVLDGVRFFGLGDMLREFYRDDFVLFRQAGGRV